MHLWKDENILVNSMMRKKDMGRLRIRPKFCPLTYKTKLVIPYCMSDWNTCVVGPCNVPARSENEAKSVLSSPLLHACNIIATLSSSPKHSILSFHQLSLFPILPISSNSDCSFHPPYFLIQTPTSLLSHRYSRERYAHIRMSFQDLESGRRNLINGKQNPTQAVASGVFQINTAVSTFQRLVNTLGTPKDTPELREKLWEITAPRSFFMVKWIVNFWLVLLF